MTEGHKIVHGKVPYHGYTHTYEFGDVEVKLHAVGEDINKETGNDKSCGHDPGKFKCLSGHLIILHAPCPPAVQDKIIRSGDDKCQSIGHVLVDLYFFFEKVGSTKINAERSAAYDYELQNLF